MEKLKLFMLLLGCKPKGRHTEQHDIFFTIGSSLLDIKPQIQAFWPDGGKIHIDAWRTVEFVEGNQISIERKADESTTNAQKLFFLNLGGYKPAEFEEFHYKMLVIAKNKTAAIKQAKSSAFYLHTGFKGAASHIDDQYGIDVDDSYEVTEMLPSDIKAAYRIIVTDSSLSIEDEWHLGYTPMSKIK